MSPLAATASEDDLVIDEDPVRTEAAALAEDWGVTVDTAYEWRSRELYLSNEVAPAMQKAAGNELAGTWIEWRPDPRLVVSVTGAHLDTTASDGDERDMAYIDIRTFAPHSLHALRRAQALAVEQLPQLGFDASVGIRQKDNALSVRISTDEDNPVDESALTLVLDQLNVSYQLSINNVAVTPANRGGRYTWDCTSGFTVRHSATGRYGYTTAGHCPSSQNYLWYSDLADESPWRPTTYYGQSVSYDAQWHEMRPDLSNGQATVPIFQASTTDGREQLGLLSFQEGSTVFNWGSRSRNSFLSYGQVAATFESPGAHCGDFPHESQCGDTFVFVEGPASHLRACRGDSGGPVYGSTYAAGTLTHIIPAYDGARCTSSSGTAQYYFQPMSAVESALGVRLYRAS